MFRTSCGLPVREGLLISLLLIITCSVTAGCSPGSGGGETVIRINDYPLSAEEFNGLFEKAGFPEDTPANREAFLDTLINRKLILQEGVKMNMDKQEPFLDAIQGFWEQSLLKIVIEGKVRDISSDLSVTDEEVRGFYERWIAASQENTGSLEEVRDVIRWQLLREKQAILLETWIERLKNRADIEVDRKAIGIE